ncbi:MAG: glycosyltransferase family 2 protein [Polyangiaceae bacterium]|nr:glycosyltransferase family 2 protein [Polyangiaceae bacterium]
MMDVDRGAPFASVVIPVMDRLDILELVLRSLGGQTYPRDRFEVIVVDDGSVEPADRVLDPRAFEFRLEILRQENQGRAAARNRGVRRARGEVILFCDADRLPDPGWIEGHVAFHGRFDGCAAFGVPWDCFYGVERIRAGGGGQLDAIRRFSRKPEYFRAIIRLFEGAMTSSRLSWAAFLVGNSSIRRADLLRAGGFDEEVRTWGLEHFELGLRLVERLGMRIGHCSMASSYHVPHGREVSALREGIRNGMQVLARKHPRRRVALLQDFLFGEISLQALEARYGGRVSKAVASEPPIYFKGLARAPA